MQSFTKPEFTINKVDELSEPVFLACSGMDQFSLNIDGTQHQSYTPDRQDARFQINAKKTSGAPTGGRYYYAYLQFDHPVTLTNIGWHWNFYAYDKSQNIVVVRTNAPLNSTDTIGFGDCYVTFDDGATSGTLVDGWITFEDSGYNCK